jgi:branched-chain amino acid transport system ATP-binding protein
MHKRSAPLLEAHGVRACYESVEVLHGIDFQVDPGTVTAILGPNGAGKSTLLSVLAGLHAPSAGKVTYAGRPVTVDHAHALAQSGLCLIPEGRGVFPNLTVEENLWVMTHGGSKRRDVEARAFERFPKLAERRQQPAGTLSGGEQQMLSMARAVATEPALLLLDELSMGLAPIIVEELYAEVKNLAADGVTVVVVEQFAEFALGVASWAVVMAGGRVTHAGPATEIAGSLHDIYLGSTSGNGKESSEARDQREATGVAPSKSDQ